MVVTPIQIDAKHYDLFVILEKENWDRMRQYDPAQIDRENLPPIWQQLQWRQIIIAYATAEEINRITSAHTRDEAIMLLHKLSRGFKYRPEKGDSDEPYQSPAKN